MNDLVPVFAALAGGLLATLGAYANASISGRAEKREFNRKQIEEIYLLSARVVKWAERTVDVAIAASLGAAPSPEGQVELVIDEVVMRSRLYEPEARQAADDLAEAIAKLTAEVLRFHDYLAAKPFSEEVDPGRTDGMTEARTRVSAARESLVRLLEARVTTYV